MKLLRFASLAAVSFALLGNAAGQSFTNLDFESATIVPDPSSPYYPYAVYATSAVPGWTITGFLGPNELTYNDLSLGAPSVSLLGTNSQYSPPPLAGHFSIDLYGGVPPGYPPFGGSISQTGLVPASAQSLQFIAHGSFSAGPLVLSLGGQNIPFYALATKLNYTLYGGDISAFAGQVEQLMFQTPFNSGINNYWEIDNIQFSSVAVPEPGTFVLFGVCTLFFCWRMKALW